VSATTLAPTLSERLIAFVRAQQAAGLPPEIRHEAVRLLLNQLKASVGAAAHPAVGIIHGWGAGTGTGAHVLWLGTETGPQHAAMVNGALFEVLDFHDTFIETYLHAVSGVLPAVLAAAEVGGQTGTEVVTALALGVEVELAVAAILMPTGYFRGFVPLGLVGGVGAATACGILAGLDDRRLRDAIGLAMCTAGGVYETVGSMGLAWVTAVTARNGLDAATLAGAGLTAPATAFEGDKGMLASYSDESPDKIDDVLATLGSQWRILRQTYKVVPTETITHGPVECVATLRPRAGERQVDTIRFGVSPIVVTIADERRGRFGAPGSDLEARFDLRYCAAAAWQRQRFGLAEMQEPAYTDPVILALRDRVELVADVARTTFDGCWAEVRYHDGSTDRVDLDAFLGTPANPVTDAQLSELFLRAADGHLGRAQSQAVVDAAFGLDAASGVAPLMACCRLEGWAS
jgi:2-methylcitrate dehydratase PrpD